jgi:hypothetical protein
VPKLLAETTAITHVIAALPVQPACVLAALIAITFNHAGVVAISAELRATKGLSSVRHKAAPTKHHCRQKQAESCFPEFHLSFPFSGGGKIL